MEMEKFYVAPEVEILEVKVERGFVGSQPGPNVDPDTHGGWPFDD